MKVSLKKYYFLNLLMKYMAILTPTKDLVNKHLGMMRIDLKKNFTIMKR